MLLANINLLILFILTASIKFAVKIMLSFIVSVGIFFTLVISETPAK